jgi:hypothetical protein
VVVSSPEDEDDSVVLPPELLPVEVLSGSPVLEDDEVPSVPPVAVVVVGSGLVSVTDVTGIVVATSSVVDDEEPAAVGFSSPPSSHAASANAQHNTLDQIRSAITEHTNERRFGMRRNVS